MTNKRLPKIGRVQVSHGDTLWVLPIIGTSGLDEITITVRELEWMREGVFNREKTHELQTAILRLPDPPEYFGDGPAERVGWTIQRMRDVNTELADTQNELAAARKELLRRDDQIRDLQRATRVRS